MKMDLSSLNSLPAHEGEEEFLKCCGSKRWAIEMVNGRPYENVEQLQSVAEDVWWSLPAEDWLEAFHSHPKIGEKKAAAATSTQAQKWSENEQAGTRASSTETMRELAERNEAYAAKFGYIFIVCATGKTSEEMLDILRERLTNEPEQEIKIAAAEQAKITRLRLNKLLEG